MPNPFAPKKKTTKMSVKPPEPSLDPSSEVPDGTINEVMDWVGADLDRAQIALDAELADKGRKTLIDRLEEVLGD